jgi:hydroxypyruvate isomerase
MVKLAANITMMFQELPFLDRFSAAHNAGFSAVEFLFPYEWPAEQLRDAIAANELQQVLFNMSPGNWEAGERGVGSLPDREQEFQDNVGQAINYASTLGTPRIHCMAGILPADANRNAHVETFTRNLEYAAGECAKHAITVMIEPINPYDVPDYFLNTSSQALEIIKMVNAENLALQYDIYHMHRMGDDMPKTITQNIHTIGHFQIAGHPGRHEPDNGEVPYGEVLECIDQLGFAGWIGCEYLPAGETNDGLGWASRWLDHTEA